MISINIGDKFGNLIVISEAGRNKQNKKLFTCQCSCGNIVTSMIYDLSRGHTKSCGCLRKQAVKETRVKCTKHIINIGDIFERLTVVSLNFTPGKRLVNCKCYCGNLSTILVSNLVSGKVKSCGCYHKEIMASENPWLTEYNTYKHHCAVRRNLVWNLSLENFIKLCQSDCYYCECNPNTPTKVSNLKRNGIDRVDNSIGYVLENCVTCCKQCNKAKGTLSQQEFFNWINRLVKFPGASNDKYID